LIVGEVLGDRHFEARSIAREMKIFCDLFKKKTLKPVTSVASDV